MKNSENTLVDYRKIETNTRVRAEQIKLIYAANVPQTSWLKLDIDGAVLMTPAEFSQLPQSARNFFLDGNAVQYRNDRVAMRGERTIPLDGYYSGGAGGAESGLGNIVNGITSLLKPYGIRIHFLISLRKSPFEHEFMYKVFYNLLKDLEYDKYVTIIEEE